MSYLQGITTFALNSDVRLRNAKVMVQCRKGGRGVAYNLIIKNTEMFTSMLTLSLLQGITTFALNSVVQHRNAEVIMQCHKGGEGWGGEFHED